MTTYTTWDPDNQTSNIVLSGGNLTVGASNSSDGGVLGVDAQAATGQFYFEVTVTTFVGTDAGVGVAWTDPNGIGSAGDNACIVFKSGNIYVGNSHVASLGSIANGAVIETALSLTNGKVWIRVKGGNWNGSGTADPATNIGGLTIPSTRWAWWPIATVESSTDSFVANFGASVFSDTVPTGFTPGWPTNPVIIPATFATPTPFSAALTLSGSNLTATRSGSSNGFAWAQYTRSGGGKWYFEFTTSGVSSSNYRIGLVNNVEVESNALGGSNNSLGYAGTTGIVELGGSTVATIATYGSGANVGVALDLINYEIWFRVNGGNWNNSGSASPATNVGGISLASLLVPVAPAVEADTNGNAFTANFGARGFIYSVPSGFIRGWPVAAAAVFGTSLSHFPIFSI